jgi:hypothetical protein
LIAAFVGSRLNPDSSRPATHTARMPMRTSMGLQP